MDGCPEDQVELITAEEDDPIHVDAFRTLGCVGSRTWIN